MALPTRAIAMLTGAALAGATTFIAGWEGFYAKWYYDSVGVKTICYGATAVDAGVDFNRVYTKAECQKLLEEHLKMYDRGMVACLKPPRPITDKMHAAFLSATYNIGIEGFCHSSMARNVNRGDFKAACHSLRLWNKGGGRVIRGLDNRRRAEEKLCLQGL